MKIDTNLKNLAMAAVLGLFLGACAHQEGNQMVSEADADEGAVSSESASLEEIAESNEEGAAELAPLPSLGDSQQASIGNLEELDSAKTNDTSPGSIDASAESPAYSELESTPSYSDYYDEPAVDSPAEAPKAAAKSVAKTFTPSPALTLPTAPIERQDELLNRFYVVRAEDTPERVSELMYGNADKANDLKAWNPGSWKTGSLIYYLSPLQPADGEMRSFYTERGMVPTEYEVKQGDTLASIALATYGNMDSWKEIGLLNEIRTPDSVELGRRLALFPANLSGYSLKLESAKNATNPEAPVDKQIDSLESQIVKLEADLQKESAQAPSEKEAQEAGIVGSKPLLPEGETTDLAAIGRARQKSRIAHGVSDADGETDVATSEVAAFFKSNLVFILSFLMALVGFGVFLFVRHSRNDSSDV